MEGEGKKEEESSKKIIHTYPLIRACDMVDEMRGEAMELCVTACEKHSANNEMAAKMIKETMDKKFGPSWHAVVGEGYGFEISYECKNLLYMFFGECIADCLLLLNYETDIQFQVKYFKELIVREKWEPTGPQRLQPRIECRGDC